MKLAVVCLALLCTSATMVSAQGSGRNAPPTRIAFVRGAVLFDSIPSRPLAEARLGDEVRLAETRVRLASDTLRVAVEWFSSRQHEMAPMQREAAMLTLRARELQLEDMVLQLNLVMQQKREVMEAPLTACVQGAMERVRSRDRWHAILDVASLSPAYAISAEVDVTDAVLRAMHQLVPGVCGDR